MTERDFKKLYKQKNDDLKAPEDLVASTLQKMLLEKERLDSAAQRQAAQKKGRRAFYWGCFAAAAACICLLSVALLRSELRVPVTVLPDGLLTMERDQFPAAIQGMPGETWDAAQYGDYIGGDIAGLLKGFAPDKSLIRVWRDAEGNIAADHARLSYMEGDKQATLLLSAHTPVGPAALQEGESVEINGRIVRFGFSREIDVRYALWQEGEVSYCLQSGDYSRGQFIRLVRSLPPFASASEGGIAAK